MFRLNCAETIFLRRLDPDSIVDSWKCVGIGKNQESVQRRSDVGADVDPRGLVIEIRIALDSIDPIGDNRES